jgi:molybdopterin converting factor subunit 1
VKVRLRFFASLREITGCEEQEMEVAPGTSAGGLWEMLVDFYPKLSGYSRSIQVAVNQDFADKQTELQPSDEVAFLPPVSGG